MLRDNLAGLIEPMLSSVAAHTLGGHPKRDKLEDAPGQPSWRSSLVSDPSAKFSVGNRATGEKNERPGFKVTTQAHDSRAVRTAQHKTHRTIDPQCLENPRPEGAESTLTGNAASPFPAEHDLLQIVTVGLGSPLGREVAPREVGAVFAGGLSDRAGLTPEFRRVMVACSAGAGLAAVYNVPLGGTLFVLEVLLATLSLPALIPAFATCVIATVVAWVGLGNESQYSLPPLAISSQLVVWSIVMGPVFGFAAYWFVRVAGAVRTHAPRDWRLPLWCAVAFPVIGLLAIPFPQLLGNGKSVAQEVFGSNIGLTLAVVLLLLRVLVTLGALRAGAEGGLLTPGLSIGALLGIILGGFWNYAWPGVPLAAFAIIGGAAFLPSSMKMPLTAVVLIMEFTRVGHDFLIPMLFAVIGSVSVFYLCTQHILQLAWRGEHDDILRSVSRGLTAAQQMGP